MTFPEFRHLFQEEEVVSLRNFVDDTPVVSICVQTFNQKEYIIKCLDSLLMQKTDFPFEILLGDDGSDDGTREICIQYANKFPDKIRLFLHSRKNNIQVNGKSTGLFNSLFNLYSAKGRYIAYCDGDDYWTDPQKLQKQVSFMENNPNYVLTYHSALIVDKNGNLIKENLVPNIDIKNDFTARELQQALEQPIISTWCFRNIIHDIPVELTYTLNADNFWMSLLGLYGQGKFLNNIAPSHYRIHSIGIWSLIDKTDRIASKMKTYNNLSTFYAERGDWGLSDFFNNRYENYTKMVIYQFLSGKKFDKVLYYLIVYLKRKLIRK